MSTPEDLRRVLADHADRVLDRDLGARVGSVRRRVRVVRRRRRAAAAVVTAAAVALVAGVALSLGGPHDEDRHIAATVVGVPVPATVVAQGFTYDYSDSRAGAAGSVSLRLPASDQPRLVSWATSGEDDDVTVTGGGTTTRTRAGDFTDWVLVSAGRPVRISVSVAAGEPGLAVYTLSDTVRPPGYTRAGVTFRQDEPGRHLLGAAIAGPGASEVHVDVVADSAAVAVRYFCTGQPTSAVSPGVSAGSFGAADGTPGTGPAGGRTPRPCGRVSPSLGSPAGELTRSTRPGSTYSASAVVGADTRGVPALADASGLVVGVAVYSLDERPGTVAAAVPPLIEHGGHTWRRVSVAAPGPGARSVVARAPEVSTDILAVAHGTSDGTYRFGGGARGALAPSVQSTGPPGTTSRPARFATWDQPVTSGVRVRVSTPRAAAAGGLRVAFYVHAD